MTRIALISVSTALALASCQTTNLDDTIARNLPKTCQLIQVAHAAFVAASASGDIPARTVAKELAAYEGVAVICADPTNVTAANALVVVATAYATISLAMKEASK